MRDVIECVTAKSTKKRCAEFPLLLEKWAVLKELVNVLRIPYEATVKLQRRDLTLSDTYGIWLEIRLRLNKIIRQDTIGLVHALLDKFIGRYEVIYNNPAMKAAIFLDPRYRMAITQSTESVSEAKIFIMNMHRRLSYLKARENAPRAESDGSSADTFENFNTETEMLQFWNSQDELSSNVEITISDIEVAIDAFDPPHVPINSSLFDYWETKDCNRELREVALAIFSISPSEVQCERDFSHLKRILSDLRSKLLPETLQNILTINLNKDIYLKVNDKQVFDMKK